MLFEVCVRAGYLWLFFLSVAAMYRSVTFGLFADRLNVEQPRILYDVFLLILVLSAIQTYQSVDLLFGKISPSAWWVPMFCKHASLLFYHVFLSFARRNLLNLQREKGLESKRNFCPLTAKHPVRMMMAGLL